LRAAITNHKVTSATANGCSGANDDGKLDQTQIEHRAGWQLAGINHQGFSALWVVAVAFAGAGSATDDDGLCWWGVSTTRHRQGDGTHHHLVLIGHAGHILVNALAQHFDKVGGHLNARLAGLDEFLTQG
jgi:hypothetical protein